MITAVASSSTVQRTDQHTGQAAQSPSGHPASADRLLLHILVGLILGAAFAVAQDNAFLIVVGGALGVLFGGSGAVLDRRSS